MQEKNVSPAKNYKKIYTQDMFLVLTVPWEKFMDLVFKVKE